LVGSRHEYPIDARTLVRLIPDILQADVFVCGPGDLVDSVVASVGVIGVPPERIHHEAFRMHST
jgi:ferredoxin-NADP reductase